MTCRSYQQEIHTLHQNFIRRNAVYLLASWIHYKKGFCLYHFNKSVSLYLFLSYNLTEGIFILLCNLWSSTCFWDFISITFGIMSKQNRFSINPMLLFFSTQPQHLIIIRLFVSLCQLSCPAFARCQLGRAPAPATPLRHVCLQSTNANSACICYSTDISDLKCEVCWWYSCPRHARRQQYKRE